MMICSVPIHTRPCTSVTVMGCKIFFECKITFFMFYSFFFSFSSIFTKHGFIIHPNISLKSILVYILFVCVQVFGTKIPVLRSSWFDIRIS